MDYDKHWAAQLELAKKIAADLHKNQKRWGGEPYVTHLEAVAEQVEAWGARFEAVAWLHDVIEDCGVTWKKLVEMGVDIDIVEEVASLSHKPDELYLTYILRVKGDMVTRVVKIADLKHNLKTSDPANATHKGKGGKTLRDKWMLALYILEH